MRRPIAEKPMLQYPSEVRSIWYTRHKELEPEVFERLPNWMQPRQSDFDFQHDIERALVEALETITEREAKVLWYRFWADMTLEEVGRILGVHKERIRQIEAKALRKLKHPSRRDVLVPFAQWAEWLKDHDKRPGENKRRANADWYRKFTD